MYRILFSCLLCVSLGVLALGGRIQETTETTLNPAHLAKSFNLKKFELMSDENFSGIVSIDKHPDFDTFFTKPLILLESKNKLGTTLKVSVDYLIR